MGGDEKVEGQRGGSFGLGLTEEQEGLLIVTMFNSVGIDIMTDAMWPESWETNQVEH